jgi:flagellar hook assembly protein FlgD
MPALPELFTLHQNYPNPFNPATTISFSLARATDVRLMIFNALGQKVRFLYEDRATAGRYDINWDGTDDNGRQVASGVYFYRLETEFSHANRKMLLVK